MSFRDVIATINDVTRSHLSVFKIFWDFPIENEELIGEQEKSSIICVEDGIEKSVPRDHNLSSLDKPCDANR